MFINGMAKGQEGFSLIEVLVAGFILAVGLLGVGSMQLSSIKMNVGAYNQSQANIVITEILDRMRLNQAAYLSGDYDDVDTDDDAPSAQSCITENGGCTEAQLAVHDIRAFTGFFNDVNELGDNFVASIPGGSATIIRDTTTDVATVSVSWDQEVWTSDANGKSKSVAAQQVTISVRI
jgi:type IV pilus assembly protein PilV